MGGFFFVDYRDWGLIAVVKVFIEGVVSGAVAFFDQRSDLANATLPER